MSYHNNRPTASSLLSAFIGLSTRDGIPCYPGKYSQLYRLKNDATFCKGVFTNNDGETYKEASILVHRCVTRGEVVDILNYSDQECALVGDDFGRWYLLDEHNELTYLGRMATLTEPPKGPNQNYSVVNGRYWQVQNDDNARKVDVEAALLAFIGQRW